MENTPSENNKRIAKNTMFLYFRSILLLLVGLYTSREVLAQLGVSDFGVYNVVGGVIVLFSFIQNAMSSATSRFFTFDLGKGDFEQLKKTFSLSVVIHVFTALIIFVLGETVGLWFLNTQLVIPEERMGAANFVYQFSVLSACVGILQVPYMVAINAHERMKVYAYFGIADAVFKLAVAVSLGFASVDKLKFYSFLLFAVYAVMVVFYWIYCYRSFPETHFKWFWDRKMFLERMGFSSYELLGAISAVLAVQGGTILINRFYGILLNAANGVSERVTAAANQFTTNFFAAIAPQITKSLSKGEMDYFYLMVIRSSKFCFLLSFLVMAPLALQIDFVLGVWLKVVPDYTGIFCQLNIINIILCFTFIPVWHGIISTGKNKRLRIIDSLMIMLMFPLIYFGLHFSPIGYMCSHIMINFFRVIYAMFSLRKLTGFSIQALVSQSLLRCLAVCAISIPLPLFVGNYLSGVYGFFASCLCFLVMFVPSSLFLVLTKNEKNRLFDFVKARINFLLIMFKR
jgi:O-antigen/teichoic acid export membrane protein